MIHEVVTSWALAIVTTPPFWGAWKLLDWLHGRVVSKRSQPKPVLGQSVRLASPHRTSYDRMATALAIRSRNVREGL
jgi:hypothetical protein